MTADWREMVPDPDPFADAPWPPEPSRGRRALDGDGLARIAASYAPVDWAAAFAAQPEDTDWLHGEWLERGTLNALFAKPGTGKSLLALETAVDLIRTGLTVVYLDQENRICDLVDRLRAFGCQAGDLERLRLFSFAHLPPLDGEPGGLHLLALAEANRPDLLIIDTATRMVTGRENDSDTFLALYRHSLVPLKARGVTVLRLDHPGKDETRGQRGSSAKDGDVDTAWRMDTLTEGLAYRLERTKSRSGHGPAAFALRRRYEPLRHEWSEMDRARGAAEAAKVAEILSAADAAGLPPEAGRDAVRKAITAAGMSATNALLSAAVKARKAVRGQVADSADSSAAGPLSVRPPRKGADSGQAPVPQPRLDGTIAARERRRGR
jgi:AAA domain